MTITHRVTLYVDEAKRSELADFGIVVGLGAQTLLIESTHPSWPLLQAKFTAWQACILPETRFDDSELAQADFLVVQPRSHQGYPEPSNDFGFLGAAYDLSTHCSWCGTGEVQREAFRLRKEPTWGRRHILQLNWVYDAYFVKVGNAESVFEEFGVQRREVLKHSTNEVLPGIRQLVPQGTARIGDNLNAYPGTHCDACGRHKYLPITKGRFPALSTPPEYHYFVSEEEFGSARSSHREVFVSQALYTKLALVGLRGVTFVPVSNS